MAKKMKEELLKMLKSEMMGMKNEGKKDLFGDIMPKTKVTVMGDSPEAVQEGLSKAEQIMKAKLGEKAMEDGGIAKEASESKEEITGEKCKGCGKSPCKC